MDPMAAIRDTFFQECEEQLAELEAGLMAMEQGGGDAETVNAVFRAVHSIKGGAGAFALDDLVRFAHVFETSLDLVRSGRMAASPIALKLMLRATDTLADLVRVARDGGSADDHQIQALAQELRELNGSSGSQKEESPSEPSAGRPTAESMPGDDDGMGDFVFTPVAIDDDVAIAADVPPKSERVWIINLKPHAALYAKANETAFLLRELARLGRIEVTIDTSLLPDLAELDPEGAYLGWTVRLHGECSEAAIRELTYPLISQSA